jgi:hypothetical protein
VTGVLGLAGVARLAGLLVLAAALDRALTGVLGLAGVARLAGVLVLTADLDGAFREDDFLRPVVLTLDLAFALTFRGAAALAFTDFVFFPATMCASTLNDKTIIRRHGQAKKLAGNVALFCAFAKGGFRQPGLTS